MIGREKELWPRAANNSHPVATIFFVICSALIFSCQQTREDAGQAKAHKASEKKSEYHEYMVDSLEVSDQFINLANKVIRLLGRPRGEGLLSEYDWHVVKYHKSEIEMLILEVNEVLAAARKFDEKYSKRPESKFCSKWTISSVISSLNDIDKRKDYEYKDEGFRRWSYIGDRLGTFVYNVEQLVGVLEDNTWLFTREDLEKRKKELEKEVVRLKEERARQLEEKFKKK
jgi:hypothetical protein